MNEENRQKVQYIEFNHAKIKRQNNSESNGITSQENNNNSSSNLRKITNRHLKDNVSIYSNHNKFNINN